MSEIESSRTKSSQVESSQVESSPVESIPNLHQVRSGQAKSGQYKSGQVEPNQIRSSQLRSSQVRSAQLKVSSIPVKVSSSQLNAAQAKLERTSRATKAGSVSMRASLAYCPTDFPSDLPRVPRRRGPSGRASRHLSVQPVPTVCEYIGEHAYVCMGLAVGPRVRR